MQLIYEDASWLMGKLLFLFITIPLLIAWSTLGLFVDLSGADVISAISGPAYFFILMLALGGFISLFPIAIGMGSTREQFLKSFYIVGIASVAICLLFLNIGQYILVRISHNILHPGIFLMDNYHFFAFLLIDIMFGWFLFGMALFSYCVLYRLGISRSLVVLMVIAIAGIFLYYGGALDSTFAWMGTLDMDAMVIGNMVTLGNLFLILLGVLGLVVLLITYPLMKNASLKPKSRE